MCSHLPPQVHCCLQLSTEITDAIHEQTVSEFIREIANSVLSEELNKKRYVEMRITVTLSCLENMVKIGTLQGGDDDEKRKRKVIALIYNQTVQLKKWCLIVFSQLVTHTSKQYHIKRALSADLKTRRLR